MNMNLFSTFDFYSANIFFNNYIMLGFLFFFPLNFWFLKSRFFILFFMFKFLKKEFNLLMGKKLFGGTILYITFFMFVLQFNICGMFPYVFILTSQLNMNLYLSLTFFFVFFLVGWFKLPIVMLSHLTPLGSPNILSPILVLIEITSMMIRPLTLSVRLTANIISGHILMEIMLGPSEKMMILISLMYSFLFLPIFSLEMMVCFVQSFVISSLSSLYISEPLMH